MKSVIIIPARYQSSRFPGKPLKKILNKEMIIWVAEACEKVLDKKLGIYPWHFGDTSKVIVSSVWGKLDKKVYDDNTYAIL